MAQTSPALSNLARQTNANKRWILWVSITPTYKTARISKVLWEIRVLKSYFPSIVQYYVMLCWHNCYGWGLIAFMRRSDMVALEGK